MCIFTLDIELLVLFEPTQFSKVAQTHIPDPTDDLRTVGPNHLLQICQKRLVDRQEVVNVSKQSLGLVRGDDSGVLAPGEVPERVGIVILEDLQASDV